MNVIDSICHNIRHDGPKILRRLTKYILIYKGFQTVYLGEEIPQKLYQKLSLFGFRNRRFMIASRDNLWYGIECFYGYNNLIENSSNLSEKISHSKLISGFYVTNKKTINNYYNVKNINREELNKIVNKEFIKFISEDKTLLNRCARFIKKNIDKYPMSVVSRLNRDIRKLIKKDHNI